MRQFIIFLFTVLFLICSPLYAYAQPRGVWVHPEMIEAIQRTEGFKGGSGTRTRRNYIIVDGKKRYTGFLPEFTQYQGAMFRDFPVWRGRTAGQPIPKELDFTKISPPSVVNQQCGDCWAQGAAMAFEGVIGWHDKVSRNISRQSIIDCSGYGSCNGGFISVGFFETPKGAVYTSDYPYKGYNQRCQSSSLIYQEQARATGFIRGDNGSKPKVQDYQRAMMEMGPIEVCGAASALSGYDKDGFIYYNKRGATNHCWAAYGWLDGKTHGKKDGVYFIFVNSWGKNWGKGGVVYVRVAQDDENLDGSVLTEGAYIDYKDTVPEGPVQFELDNGKTKLKVVVEPGELSAASVKESLELAGF